MDKERFLKTGLLEQYALGLTDEEESFEVEQYAEAYPDVREAIEELQQAVGHHALQYALMPVAELRARVRQSNAPAPTKPASRPPARPVPGVATRYPRLLLSASLAISALAVFVALSFYQGKKASDQQYQQMSSEYHALQQSCARQQAEQAKLQAVYAFLSHKQTTPVVLPGNQLLPMATATVFWNEESRTAYINPAGLPAPPQGKTYQLWADVHGEMVNLGLVKTHRHELQPVAYTAEAESLNLTIEPEGGSIEPTVALLIASNKL